LFGACYVTACKETFDKQKVYSKLFTSYQLPVTSYQLPVTSYQLPVTSYQLPVTSYQLPVTSYQLPVRLPSCIFLGIISAMPITRSAKKAVKVSARKKVINDRRRRVMREETKTVKSIIAGKTKGDAVQELSKAYKAIDKAAKRGVIKKNTAARKKSRLATAVAKASK